MTDTDPTPERRTAELQAAVRDGERWAQELVDARFGNAFLNIAVENLAKQRDEARERVRVLAEAATWRSGIDDALLDRRIADHEKQSGKLVEDVHDYRALVALRAIRRALAGAETEAGR